MTKSFDNSSNVNDSNYWVDYNQNKEYSNNDNNNSGAGDKTGKNHCKQEIKKNKMYNNQSP